MDHVYVVMLDEIMEAYGNSHGAAEAILRYCRPSGKVEVSLDLTSYAFVTNEALERTIVPMLETGAIVNIGLVDKSNCRVAKLRVR